MQQLDLLETQQQQTDLTVRISKRARNMTIHVIPHAGVEVVVPKRTSPDEVQKFVDKHRRWISKTQQQLDAVTDAPVRVLPAEIDLAAIGKKFTVQYQSITGPRGWRYLGTDVIGVACSRSEFKVGLKILRSWLQHEGKRWLVPWLKDVRDELGMTFKRVQVRGQKTRWGSYSSSGTLSINYYLMFLEPGLVRYLFIHELCHTKHMNHSRKFWSLVSTFDSDYREKESRLNQTRELVPAWLL